MKLVTTQLKGLITDPVAVEIDVDASGSPSSKFSDHFKANSGMDPDHHIDLEVCILFAGLSHNSKQLTERNMSNGMPGCACEPPATFVYPDSADGWASPR